MFSSPKVKQGMGPIPRPKRRVSSLDPSAKRKSGLALRRDKIKGLILLCICLIFIVVIYCVSTREASDVPPEGDAKANVSPERPLTGSTNSGSSKGTDQNTLNVALAITVTKDPGSSDGFLDSITALSVSIDEAKSRHSITKVALVHDDVFRCVPVLWHFGFEVLSKPIPVKLDEIKNPEFVKEVKTSGCCGELELLKLHIWTWTEYDYVLMMDADMQWHQNFDHIFDAISMGNIPNAKTKDDTEYMGKYLAWTHGATADFSGGKFKGEVMNGGFLVVRPNMAHYGRMVELFKEGDFRPVTAWKGSGIGWVYGGPTIQGLVPYLYFGEIGKGVADVDRCVFNVECFT